MLFNDYSMFLQINIINLMNKYLFINVMNKINYFYQ